MYLFFTRKASHHRRMSDRSAADPYMPHLFIPNLFIKLRLLSVFGVD